MTHELGCLLILGDKVQTEVRLDIKYQVYNVILNDKNFYHFFQKSLCMCVYSSLINAKAIYKFIFP